MVAVVALGGSHDDHQVAEEDLELAEAKQPRKELGKVSEQSNFGLHSRIKCLIETLD